MRIFFSIILIVYSFQTQAQKTAQVHKWGIKAGYSFNKDWGMFTGNIGDIRVESNYDLMKCLKVGGYTGYSVTQTMITDDYMNHRMGTNSPVINYGINASFSLIPAFFNTEYRYSPYVTVKTGGYYIFADNDYKPSGTGVTFFSGFGLSFSVLDWLNVYGEYGIGFGEGTYRNNIYQSKNEMPDKNMTSFRFGLEFRL